MTRLLEWTGTHTAGSYTLLDPTSPMWMRDDTIFAPTYVLCHLRVLSAFVTWSEASGKLEDIVSKRSLKSME